MRYHRSLGSREIGPWVPVIVLFATVAVPPVADAQMFQWTRQFGTAMEDEARGVAVDATGVYVIWTASGVPRGEKYKRIFSYVRKYDKNGSELWTRKLFDEEYWAFVNAVASDGRNVCVTGQFNSDSLNAHHVFVRKYDINGDELWSRQFGDNDIPVAEPRGVAINSSEISVLGQFSDGVFLRKYDANGNELWTGKYQMEPDELYGAAVFDASSVYLVGLREIDGDVTKTRGFVHKYDTKGKELWIRQFSSEGPYRLAGFMNNLFAHGASADATGVYIAGSVANALPGQSNAGGSSDAYVRKYDTNGSELWTHQFGDSRPLDTEGAAAKGVASDATAVYVFGTGGALVGHPPAGKGGAFVRKYDPNGNELWTSQFGTTGNATAMGVAVDATGVYVVGETDRALPGQRGAGRKDACIIRLTPDSAPIPTRK